VESAKPGTLLIDTSMIRPEVSVRVAEAAEQRSLGTVDAPVSGGEPVLSREPCPSWSAARRRTSPPNRSSRPLDRSSSVSAWPGQGRPSRPLTSSSSPAPSSSSRKRSSSSRRTTSTPPRRSRSWPGGSRATESSTASPSRLRGRQFQPGFRVDLHHKDLGIVTAAARDVGVAIPLVSLVAQLMSALRAQGHGAPDHSALLLVEQLSGRGAAEPCPRAASR